MMTACELPRDVTALRTWVHRVLGANFEALLIQLPNCHLDMCKFIVITGINTLASTAIAS